MNRRRRPSRRAAFLTGLFPGLLPFFPDSPLFEAHFATGIVNSAPFSVLSGQRCMIDFCFV